MAKTKTPRTAGTVYRLARKVGRRTEYATLAGWVSQEVAGKVWNERPDANESLDQFCVPYRLLRLTSAKKNTKRTR